MKKMSTGIALNGATTPFENRSTPQMRTERVSNDCRSCVYDREVQEVRKYLCNQDINGLTAVWLNES